MKRIRTRFLIGLATLIGALMLGLSGGCVAAKPKIVCVMKNPETGERVTMYKELWFKNRWDYDEKKHIKQWKADQRKKGYSVEVRD